MAGWKISYPLVIMAMKNDGKWMSMDHLYPLISDFPIETSLSSEIFQPCLMTPEGESLLKKDMALDPAASWHHTAPVAKTSTWHDLIESVTIKAGWWSRPTPLKNMEVNWDNDIPNIWKMKFMFQTTNQKVSVYTEPNLVNPLNLQNYYSGSGPESWRQFTTTSDNYVPILGST